MDTTTTTATTDTIKEAISLSEFVLLILFDRSCKPKAKQISIRKTLMISTKESLNP